MGETFVLFYCLCTGASEQQFYSPSWRVCVFTLTKRKGSLPIHAMSVSEKMLPHFSCCKCVMKNGSDWICWKHLCLKRNQTVDISPYRHTHDTQKRPVRHYEYISHRGSTWEYRCWQRSHDCNCAAEVKHTNTHTPSDNLTTRAEAVFTHVHINKLLGCKHKHAAVSFCDCLEVSRCSVWVMLHLKTPY